MSPADLVHDYEAAYRERPDGALRVMVRLNGEVFALSPEQAEGLEAQLHDETQKAVEQVAREVDRFA